jgi:hypothetical protein
MDPLLERSFDSFFSLNLSIFAYYKLGIINFFKLSLDIGLKIWFFYDYE